MISPHLLTFATLLALLSTSLACTVTNLPPVEIVPSPLTQGNYGVVCAKVNVTTSGGSSQFEYYFKTILDDMSQLTMTGLASKLTNASYATVTVYFQNAAAGTQFTLVDSTNSIQRHFLSTVINLSQGSLSSIVGDNFCDSGCTCYQGECFESNTGGYGSVDGVIYVTWGGDDANGKSMLSSSRRFSRFSMYSVGSLSSAVRSSLGI
jgi:hypothetical protein